MTTAITIENLSKKYIIGHQRQEKYTALRDVMMHKIRSIGQRLRHPLSPNREETDLEEFWALKDINLEIKQGERVGIIGRNGVGKSTLLKILSRITEPTAGRVTINGRVASLLEVGTGFHPELTGRENIFLNGAILGMSRTEIMRKFDEIVDFAEIEKFLDTPVKRYSSGMYVRLAFAVAAHLEPEILVVDEVLAVGDTIFQKKCLDKMMKVSKQGRTIIFVSHNLSAIKSLCNRAILLDKGLLIYSGGIEDSIEAYVGMARLTGRDIDLTTLERKGSSQELIFDKLSFLDYPIRHGKPIRFKLTLKSATAKTIFHELDFGIAIRDNNQSTIIHCSNRYLNKHFEHCSDNSQYLFEIDNVLKPGNYSLVLFLRDKELIQDWLIDAVKIEIEDGNPYGFHDTGQIKGLIFPHFNISQFEDRL